ncbi:MAG: HNH endonuclease [Aquihabitans sp.]
MSLVDDLVVMRDAAQAVLGHLAEAAGDPGADASSRLSVEDLMVGLAATSDEVVSAAVIEAAEVLGLTDAICTVVVGEWDSRNLFRLDGSRAAGARLARDAGWSERSANHVVKRAKRLRQNRLVEEGYVNGDLSTDKTDVLCNAALPARRHLFAEAEASLVGDAKRLSCDDLQTVVDYWASAADDALGRDRSKQQHEGRRLSASEISGGAVAGEFLLDPVAGAIFTDELDRLTQQLFDDDWAIARARFGPMANSTNLPRTATQRRADALIIMAARSATMPADGRPPSPLFSVLIDDKTALRVCELVGGTVISPQLLASWITQADFERVIFDTPNRVIELGLRTRFFTGGLRRAIELRDRHCTFPGCSVPAKHCEVDHIIEYSQGGVTTQQNGRLRCPTHNRQRPGRAGQPPQGP